MHGFNQRQLEQLEEIVKRVIVQVLAEEKRESTSQPLENVQENVYMESNSEPIISEPKPKISSHLYNNGRFACCCEICGGDCGNSEYC